MASLEQAVIAAQNDRDQVGALLAPFAQDTSLRTTSHTSPVLWAGLLALLRPRQPHVDDDLAAVLRVLRVLVAGNTDHAVLLTSSGVAAQLQRLAVWLLNRLDEDGDKDKDESATAASLLLLVLVLQVVHNASASSVPTAGLFLWGLLARDTTTLQQLLLLRHSKPQGIALQWLHLVLANEPSARSQLCRTGAGLDNLAALLRAAEHLHDQDSSSSHFDRVVDTVWLLASGASDGVVGRSLHGLLANGQLAELHTLLKVLEGKTHGELARDQPTELSHEVAEHAADVLRRLIVGAEGEPSFSPGVAALAQAANEVRTDCVIVLLMILGNVAATSGSTKRTAIVDAIMRANILQTVVELLREARKIAPRSARASDSQAASSTPSVSSALFGLKREAIRFVRRHSLFICLFIYLSFLARKHHVKAACGPGQAARARGRVCPARPLQH